MSGSNRRPGRVVVGVDGSKSSIEALRWAQRIADSIGATIEAVTAWDYPPYAYAAMPEDYRPDLDATKVLDNAVASAFGETPPVGIARRILQGSPASMLMDISRGAEMLVVGSRGHGGFAGLLLGSVSAQCAEHAPCPVLVVHQDRAHDLND